MQKSKTQPLFCLTHKGRFGNNISYPEISFSNSCQSFPQDESPPRYVLKRKHFNNKIPFYFITALYKS